MQLLTSMPFVLFCREKRHQWLNFDNLRKLVNIMSDPMVQWVQWFCVFTCYFNQFSPPYDSIIELWYTCNIQKIFVDFPTFIYSKLITGSLKCSIFQRYMHFLHNLFKFVQLRSQLWMVNRQFVSSRLYSKIIHFFHVFLVVASP